MDARGKRAPLCARACVRHAAFISDVSRTRFGYKLIRSMSRCSHTCASRVPPFAFLRNRTEAGLERGSPKAENINSLVRGNQASSIRDSTMELTNANFTAGNSQTWPPRFHRIVRPLNSMDSITNYFNGEINLKVMKDWEIFIPQQIIEIFEFIIGVRVGEDSSIFF